MAVTGPLRGRFAPWAGSVAAALGVLLQHQGIGDALHFDCGFGAAAANLVAGGVALAIMAVGGWVSWASVRGEADEEASPRRFVAHLSLMAVALFAVMVVWQTMAGLIVPACPT